MKLFLSTLLAAAVVSIQANCNLRDEESGRNLGACDTYGGKCYQPLVSGLKTPDGIPNNVQYGKFCGSANKCPISPVDSAGTPCPGDFLDLKCYDHDVCRNKVVTSKVSRRKQPKENCKCDLALLANLFGVALEGDGSNPDFLPPQKQLCDEDFYTKETIPYNTFIKGPNKTVKVSEAVVVALPLCEDFLEKTCPTKDLAGYDPVYAKTVENELTFVVEACLSYLGLFCGLANPIPGDPDTLNPVCDFGL